MRKSVILSAVLFFMAAASFCFAQFANVMIDDFEYEVSGGPNGTVDFGAGNGSSVEVTSSRDPTYCNKLALKIVYNAVPGGYIWVARGQDLEAKNAVWSAKLEEVKWDEYKGFSFYAYGSNTKTIIAFDLKDSGNQFWRYMFEDNFKGWKKITCLFSDFRARGDWQPNNADNNLTMDFPIASYRFEPLPPGKGTIYIDDIELVRK